MRFVHRIPALLLTAALLAAAPTAGAVSPTPTSGPHAISWGPNRIDLFARDAPDGLWHQWYDAGAWSSPENLGGLFVGEPAVATQGPGRLDVFVVTAGGDLMVKSYNAGWTEWQSLGKTARGTAEFGVAAVSWGPGRLDVFGVGARSELTHKWCVDGVWYPTRDTWESLDGQLSATPAVSSRGPNRLDVFARGGAPTLALYHKYYEGAWSPWFSLGGQLTSAPASVSMSSDKIDVFVRDLANGVSQIFWTPQNGWSPWISLGGTLTSPPTAVSAAPGRVEVYGLATSGRVWTLGWDGARWVNWVEVPVRMPGVLDRDRSFITEVQVIAGDSDTISCPDGLERIPQDLNEGAKGKFVYLCVRRGFRNDSLYSVRVLNMRKTGPVTVNGGSVYVGHCSTGRAVPVDLNLGAGGDYIYFCVQPLAGMDSRYSYKAIRDIGFHVYNRKPAGIAGDQVCLDAYGPGWQPAGYDSGGESANEDLNADVLGSKFIFTCVLREP